jgi:hypothetical protein
MSTTTPNPIQIPPIRTGLFDPAGGTNGTGGNAGDGSQRTAKEWYYFWNQVRRQVNQDTNILAGLVTYGTAAAMPDPKTMPDGALYFQEDRNSLYVNEGGHWQYVAGTMWGTLSPDQRPTGLGVYDAGFNFRSVDTNTDYAPREFLWSQSEWIEVTQVLYGTHAARPTANEQTPARTVYVETDRGNVIYQQQANAWHYVAGTMWGTVSPTDQRPTDLSTNDYGFTFADSNNAPYQQYVWTGSVWSTVNFPQIWSKGTGGAIYYNGGNVGIANAAPPEQLSLGGYGAVAMATGNATSYLTHQYLSSQGFDALSLACNYRRTDWTAGNISSTAVGTAEILVLGAGISPVSAITFGTAGINTAPVERMRITSGGNVGIGLASPGYLFQLASDSAAKPSTNTWTIASDIRTKRNIYRFEGDMNVIRALDPIVAEYNGKGQTPEGTRVVSFDAARLREIVPQAVSSVRGKLNPDDAEETDLLGVNTHEIFYHMLRAIQYLDREVSELRQKL